MIHQKTRISVATSPPALCKNPPRKWPNDDGEICSKRPGGMVRRFFLRKALYPFRIRGWKSFRLLFNQLRDTGHTLAVILVELHLIKLMDGFKAEKTMQGGHALAIDFERDIFG